MSVFDKPTVTSELAKNPTQRVQDVAERIFHSNGFHLHEHKLKHHAFTVDKELTQEDLDKAAQSGAFPQRPSDLFLKARPFQRPQRRSAVTDLGFCLDLD
jgi:hypothetical protein